MPSYVLKLTKGDVSKYLLWSTIVDAPITYALSKEELSQELKERNEYSEDRFKRADENGTSSLNHSLADIVSYNRAGPNESCLSLDQIIEKFW